MSKRRNSTDPETPQDGLPAGLEIKAPVTREVLEADTEFDPEGAERFVQIIRALRRHSLPVGKA